MNQLVSIILWCGRCTSPSPVLTPFYSWFIFRSVVTTYKLLSCCFVSFMPRAFQRQSAFHIYFLRVCRSSDRVRRSSVFWLLSRHHSTDPYWASAVKILVWASTNEIYIKITVFLKWNKKNSKAWHGNTKPWIFKKNLYLLYVCLYTQKQHTYST